MAKSNQMNVHLSEEVFEALEALKYVTGKTYKRLISEALADKALLEANGDGVLLEAWLNIPVQVRTHK